MSYRNFKPNGVNPTCMTGDEEFPFFFFDVEQAYNGSAGGQSTFNVYNDWNHWLWDSLQIRGFRMDAVKHFPASFVGKLLNALDSTGRIPPMVVGEHFTTNAGVLKNWIDAVYANMTPSATNKIAVRAFDFELRQNLKNACDDGLFDVRNIFSRGMVDGAGMNGRNVVTFVNNHDYRTAGEHILNRQMLAYAYVLTNNKVGLPSVFHPDYYGIDIYGPSNPLEENSAAINALMQVHKTYIAGAPVVDYLNRFNTPYTSAYLQSGAHDLLLYQIRGGKAGKDVIVAINFEGQSLRVNHQINTANAPLGTQFNLVAGNAGFSTPTVENSANGITNSIYLDLPAYSYAVFVQGPPCTADADADGSPDCVDRCPNDPSKTSPGLCGCGVNDADRDSDGICDTSDNCPATPNSTIRPITVDGNISDFGPAIANGTNGVNYYFSSDNNFFYIGVTGVNLANDDIHIAFRTDDGNTGSAGGGVNFSNAPYSYRITFFNGNDICYFPFTNPNTCQQVGNSWEDFGGWSGNPTSEIRIPRNFLGTLGTGSGQVRLAIWTNNNAGNFVWSTFPTSNPTGSANVTWSSYGQVAYPTFLPQTDTDMDGVGAACDCNDNDAASVPPTGIISANVSNVCNGDSVHLSFVSNSPNGPFNIVVNGVTYTAVSSGMVFASFVAGKDFMANTDFILSAVSDNNGCTNNAVSQKISILLNPAPVTKILFVKDSIITCKIPSLVLKATGQGAFMWSNNLGNTDTAAITAPGSYSVILTAQNGCSDTATVTVPNDTISPQASIANLSGSNVLSCTRTAISLRATGGTSYLWSTGANSDSIGVSNAGTYTVTVTGANGCTKTANIAIARDTVAPQAAIANLTGSIVLTCTRTAISLRATGGTSYLWNTGANVDSIGVTASGTYTVTVTGTNGCTKTADIAITRDTVPPQAAIANLSGSSVLTCTRTAISLRATGGTSYLWNTGANSDSIGVLNAGTYTVTVTGANGCTKIANIAITRDTVAPQSAIANLTGSSVLTCTRTAISLRASGGTSYLWNTGANSDSIGVLNAGTYT
ncbi:MAG: hypothetical protein RL386_1034, partial [Bacteroidota bacterium]